MTGSIKLFVILAACSLFLASCGGGGTGATGSAGQAGQTGQIGPMGLQGPQGDTGPRGPAGMDAPVPDPEPDYTITQLRTYYDKIDDGTTTTTRPLLLTVFGQTVRQTADVARLTTNNNDVVGYVLHKSDHLDQFYDRTEYDETKRNLFKDHKNLEYILVGDSGSWTIDYHSGLGHSEFRILANSVNSTFSVPIGILTYTGTVVQRTPSLTSQYVNPFHEGTFTMTTDFSSTVANFDMTITIPEIDGEIVFDGVPVNVSTGTFSMNVGSFLAGTGSYLDLDGVTYRSWANIELKGSLFQNSSGGDGIAGIYSGTTIEHSESGNVIVNVDGPEGVFVGSRQ